MIVLHGIPWDLAEMVMTMYYVLKLYIVTACELEHVRVDIVSFPVQNGGSFYSYVNVYQRVPSGAFTSK